MDEVDKGLEDSVWNTGGCSSYYLSPSGRNFTFWPGYVFTFRRAMKHVNWDDFDVRTGIPTRPAASTTTQEVVVG
ncbi:monooxygenase [Mycobacteroides abscessus subsp. abscessus]|nr:monooxygenase [Mycobacteroides abscessus subsp. abscessus]